MSLTLEIVTPEGRVLEKPADTVVLTTATGEIGILPGHIPLATMLEAGPLRVGTGATAESLVVGRGFALIENDRVSVLTDSAINEAQIDEAAVEEAMARAQKALAEKTDDLDPAEVERLEGIVRFSVAQLVARKKR
jgi:F-type H+-transporting ATPase subunit epsilon